MEWTSFTSIFVGICEIFRQTRRMDGFIIDLFGYAGKKITWNSLPAPGMSL